MSFQFSSHDSLRWKWDVAIRKSFESGGFQRTVILDPNFSHQQLCLRGKLCKMRLRNNIVVYLAFTNTHIREVNEINFTLLLWQSYWLNVRFIGVETWHKSGLHEPTKWKDPICSGCRKMLMHSPAPQCAFEHKRTLVSLKLLIILFVLHLFHWSVCIVVSPVVFYLKALKHRHYDDVIMTMLASQITSITVVYSIVYSGVNQRKHQSSASLAFVWEIHRGPVNFPHKWPVTRKMFPFDDVIMTTGCLNSE